MLHSAYYKQPFNAATLNFDSLRYNQAHLADNQKNSIYSFETKKTSVQGRLLRNSKENVSLNRRKYTTTQTVSREKDVSPQSSEKESWDSHMSDWTINFCRPHFFILILVNVAQLFIVLLILVHLFIYNIFNNVGSRCLHFIISLYEICNFFVGFSSIFY